MPTVIQFNHPSEMLPDLSPGQVVRVTTAELTEAEGAQGQIGWRIIGTTITAVTPTDDILACNLITGRIELLMGTPADKAAYRQAKQEAEAHRQTAVDFCQARGFDVHAGLIDLGTVPRLAGSWLLETEQPAVAANGRTYPIKEIIL